MIAAIARTLAWISLCGSAVTYYRVRSRRGAWLWFPKVLSASAAPVLTLVGAGAAALGLARHSRPAAVLGLAGAALSGRYVARAAAASADFAGAFGPGWQEHIAPSLVARLPRRPWPWRLAADPEARVRRDVPYWASPDTGSTLLCDVWRPTVQPSGLAVVFVHGGAWHMGDKGQGTDAFFGHLTAQGHAVVDVAYRLAPGADGVGMVGDVKRAIAWTKGHAADLGIDPARVVLAGASAGAHLALVAAYSPGCAELTPDDVAGTDTSVCGVVSYYGPTDLRPMLGLRPAADDPFEGFCDMFSTLHRLDNGQHVVGAWPESYLTMALNMLGGQADRRERQAALLSPICLASAGCPPTLLLHGQADAMVPVEPARVFYRRLKDLGVPAAMVEFPDTDHGFDVFLPGLSVAAHVAAYDVDLFLALLASGATGRDWLGERATAPVGSRC